MRQLLYSLFIILALTACSGGKESTGGGSNNGGSINNGGNNNGGNNNGGNNNNGNGGQTPPSQPQITLEKSLIEFLTEGGSDVIIFTSTDAWTAEVINTPGNDWCTIEPTSGAAGDAMITVTTTANDTPDDRTASIVISASSASKTVDVLQRQRDILNISSSEFDVEKEGGAVTIDVESNIEFDIEISNSWIKQVDTATRALTTDKFTFTIAENVNPTKREGSIVFKSKYSDLSQTVKIYQEKGNTNIESPEDGGDYEWQN